MKNNYFEITINFISTTLNNEELIKKADGFMFIFSK
jgi:hypothetical protein